MLHYIDMKNFRFFPDIKTYREYIYTYIVVNKDFHKNPFYSGLIEFIIDNRTPLFFEASNEYERSHFTQYFNFSLLRDEYTNTYVSDLYYIHDFVHMVFNNPLEPRKLDFSDFCELAISNEYVAANETEILTYYRLPELRDKTFKEVIMYDLLSRQRKQIPEVMTLYQLRKAIIEDQFVETFFMTGQEEQTILRFLKKFNGSNLAWCRLWYDQFPSLTHTQIQNKTTLEYRGYSDVLEKYKGKNDNDSYRNNVLYNVRIMLEMLKLDLPDSFEECCEALKSAEGKVVMQQGAKEFYTTFINSKNTNV
ncbi:MAG: hypothetical protein RI947_853 [Candidatus Parcubacteria bacterium]